MSLMNRKPKPEPGVPKDAPRKKGVARFFELLARHFSDLVKLNLMYQLCILPAQLFLLAALISFFGYANAVFFSVFGLMAIVSSCTVGAANTALYHGLVRLLRAKPGFVGHDFKRIFKESFHPMMGLGIFYSVVLGAQVFAYMYFIAIQLAPNILVIAVYLLSVVLFAMVFPYVFLQGAHIDLGRGAMFKNAVLLALGALPRNLCGVLISGLLLILQFSQFPWLVPITALIGYAIPALIQMMWVWPPFDDAFQITNTLQMLEDAKENKE